MPVYQDRSADDANQGDVFEEVPFTAYVPGGAAWGMIVSQDCDCDKFLKPKTPIPDDQRPLWPIALVPVHPIEQLNGSRIKKVREGEMPRYFHLPAERPPYQPSDTTLPELVADLWLMQPVAMEKLMSCDRRASLSDEWRTRLWTQIIRLRTGRDLSKAIAKALQDMEAE